MTNTLSARRWLSLLGLLALLMSSASWAKAGTLGGIAGIVTDAKTGAPLAGVHVVISAPSENIATTTDARGHYIALSLPPDDYTLSAQKDGYDTRTVSGYSVFADQTQQYDLQLDPGSGAGS